MTKIKGEKAMPTIEANSGVITQINVFTVKPENQQALVDHLIGAASVAREIRGWKSISVHKSIDGRSVVNYAQAKSLEAQEKIFKELSEKGIVEKGHQFGEAHPGLYEVVYTLENV
ncbi:antibiotic biosynthesis monooxygenase family protein [Tunturiibacter lichenicola]|uniref:antibiotic biosynthesis monooxygenase family protein n=1 Tax=Tunturiibacter lichenicola TaxID=2051959 RepID=UPI0021B15996|nr:antibiotic biosynthesis monooxygenase [Edaphobacter lichenicola]